MDDAYINFRFSDRLAAGDGFAWNPGGPAVEGFSSLLWVVLGAGVVWVTGRPAVDVVPLLVGLGWVAAVVVFATAWRRLVDHEPLRAGWVPVVLLAANPVFGFQLLQNMEAATVVL